LFQNLLPKSSNIRAENGERNGTKVWGISEMATAVVGPKKAALCHWHPAGGVLARILFRGFRGGREILRFFSKEHKSSFTLMHAGMACAVKRNQVLLRVVAGVAAELLVVDPKIRHRAAQLTPPAIAMQDLLP
jgi:hypothetical protein